MSEPAGKPAPILFVVHSLGHGGLERQMAAIVRGLDRTRFEPHVACVLEGFRADEIRASGIPIIRIPIRSFWDPGPFALAAFLGDYVVQHRIQMIHLFDTGMGAVTALAAKWRARVRLITGQRSFMGHLSRKHRYLLLSAHWLADRVVANCNATREHLHRTYGYPLRRIEVCYNGIDILRFPSEPRQRIDALSGARLVIGCVCVLRPEKNLVQLIEVFARVRSRRSGVKLLLMGSGPEEARLRAAAAAHGLGDDCHFLPSAADVSATMRSIDIFVHPSLTESMPNAVMEAMASGCCVLATRVGGCPELIEHGVHGLLARPGDAEDLERHLEGLIDDEHSRRRMAAAAVSRIPECFSLDQALEMMGGIYERTLSLPGRIV